mmetsp:Transcript_7436/g.22673  ORF Transcript_7436/g.22673 Transcript_7436/m.22673 type:complete len:80 (-) Transcript_7436:96-335(-)
MRSSYQALVEDSSNGSGRSAEKNDGQAKHVIVKIPAGVLAGDVLQATGPDGKNFAFKVPPKVKILQCTCEIDAVKSIKF